MDNLKMLRKQRGLSQAAFARDIHASQNTVSQWEKGLRQPNNDTLKEIAEYFNVSTDFLLGISNESQSDEINKELQGIDFALYGETKDLTDAEKQDILSYIKFKKSQRGESV